MTVAEYIAEFLEERGIKHVFGIIGAGNAAIFDAIHRRGFTEIICTHHEQAAVMAAASYYRINGTVTCALVTTGAGSTNAITGVMSAWMDSIPVVVISGNESTKNIEAHQGMRAWGVQGYDSVAMVKDCTVVATRLDNAFGFGDKFDQAFFTSDFLTERTGPVWIDIPMDVQSKEVEENETHEEANQLIKDAKRPVLYLGRGADIWGSTLVEQLQFPAILSWSALELLPSDHVLNFGSCGVYGQRAANQIIEESDLVICLGTRLALPQIGYDIKSFAPNAELIIVDVDEKEFDKFKSREAHFFPESVGFFREHIDCAWSPPEWFQRCDELRKKYPRLEAHHFSDKDEQVMNSYQFMQELETYLKPDSVIVTDVGAPLLSAHYMLKLKKGQKLFTSQGLGEMGFAVPASIGASFAKNKGEIICLVGDGGIMMNLQELQTIVHHNLPIKIFIFNNDGYGMIKGTQKQLFEGRAVGVDKKSGVSCPDFTTLGAAMGFKCFRIHTKADMAIFMKGIMEREGPVICEVFMDPDQEFLPKLKSFRNNAGEMCSPAFNQLSPLEG